MNTTPPNYLTFLFIFQVFGVTNHLRVAYDAAFKPA